MKATFDIEEAEALFPELLERAHGGEEIVITRDGAPYARMVPIEALPPRRPGFLQGTLGPGFFEPLPADELRGWGE